MKFILVSNLYPNPLEPSRGLYNLHLMHALQTASHTVEVIAPVAYFPGRDKTPPREDLLGKSKIQNPKSEIPTPHSRVPNPKSKIQNPKSEIPTPHSRVPNPKSEIPNPKSQMPPPLPPLHPRYFYTPGFLIHHHWRFYRLAVAPLLKQRIQAARNQTADRRLQTADHLISHKEHKGTQRKSLFAILCALCGHSNTGHQPQRTQGNTKKNPLCDSLRSLWPFQHRASATKNEEPAQAAPTLPPSLKSKVQSPKSSQNSHIILGFAYPDAVAMASVCRQLGVSYSVLVLGSDFRIRMQQPKFRPLVLDCLKKAPLIFCPGKALARDMAAAGIDAAKIHPFNNGVDPDIFFADDTPRANELLFVGNLVPVKAPERIINAFHALADLRSGGLRLVMIGSGPLRAALQQTAGQLGIPEDQIEWAGTLPQARLADRMRKARLLCLCSRSEGMPNVVIEALACGCPVVATSVGEVPDMLNAQNGIAVAQGETEPDTIRALAAAIAKALASAYDHAAIAAATVQYRWERVADVITEAVCGGRS